MDIGNKFLLDPIEMTRKRYGKYDYAIELDVKGESLMT